MAKLIAPPIPPITATTTQHCSVPRYYMNRETLDQLRSSTSATLAALRARRQARDTVTSDVPTLTEVVIDPTKA